MDGAELAGIVTGCVGVATGVGALVVAALGERRAGRAEQRAEEATAGAASLEVSLQRIADNLERDRAFERLQSPAQYTGPELRVTPRHKPEFHVEFVRGRAYRLRNVSSVLATKVDITVGNFPAGLTRGLNGTVDLAPMSSTEPFVIIESWGNPAPGELTVSCAELDEPVVVPLPARS